MDDSCLDVPARRVQLPPRADFERGCRTTWFSVEDELPPPGLYTVKLRGYRALAAYRDDGHWYNATGQRIAKPHEITAWAKLSPSKHARMQQMQDAILAVVDEISEDMAATHLTDKTPGELYWQYIGELRALHRHNLIDDLCVQALRSYIQHKLVTK